MSIPYHLDSWGSWMQSFLSYYNEGVAVSGKFAFVRHPAITEAAKKRMGGWYAHPFISLVTCALGSVGGAVIGSIGATLCKLAEYMKGENGLLLKGGSNLSEGAETKLISWNVCGIAGAGIFDGINERFSRLNGIAQKINEYITADKPFVFLGQECFGHYSHALWNKVKGKAAYGAIRGGSKIFGMDSGLMMVTNKKVEKVVHRTFSKVPELSRGSVSHGFQIIYFSDMVVVNTHFDKGTNKATESSEKLAILHEAALVEIQAELGAEHCSVYLAGDLNNKTVAKSFWLSAKVTCTNQIETEVSGDKLKEETLDVLALTINGQSDPHVEMTTLSDHGIITVCVKHPSTAKL
jgi:exonuclease III